MIVTVFRNRLNPAGEGDYHELVPKIAALAKAMPGYVSHKTFTAEDGERVTIVEFESEEAQRAWATHAEHVKAKALGRASFYSEYSIQVCTVTRESRFPPR